MASERKFSDYQWAVIFAVAAFFLLMTASVAAGNEDEDEAFAFGAIGWFGFYVTGFLALVFFLRGFFRR